MNKIDTSTWKEFKLSDLFTAETGDIDLQQKDVNGKGIALVSSGETNMGIIGSTDIPAKIVSEGTITVDMFGSVQYRNFPYKMVTHARVFALVPKEPINQEIGLFLATLLQKLTSEFSYNNMCSWNKIKDFKILLPATIIERPDWEYMEERIKELEEERIKELEEERIKELEAYLITTGLDDYELTEEDKKTLSLSTKTRFDKDGYDENFDGIWMKEFKIGDLFEKLPLKNKVNFNKKLDISQIRTKEFNLPLVNAKNGNNGIMYYGRSTDYESAIMTIGIVNDGAISTGNVNPHPESTGVLYNAYLIKPIYNKLSREILEYLSCCLQKTIKHQFGYDNKASWDKVKELYILLPTTSDNFPDFNYMEKYIRTIEKLTIKKVYEDRGLMIKKTKEVIKE